MYASLMKNYILRILIFISAILAVSCSREGVDKGKNAVVRLRMPSPVSSSGGVVSFAINDPGGWSPTDPVTLSDILCYVVAVSGPEDLMQKYTCSQVDGTPVMNATYFGGPALPDDVISMSIPSGSARTFHIIGIAATTVNDCLNFTITGTPLREEVAAPHIIGEKTVDLVPGELDLNVEISMTGAVKFNSCTGPYFNPDPAVIVISDGPTYDYGDHAVGSSTDYTFTLENKGGSAATGLSETGLASPYSLKGGSWPGTGGTCGASLDTSLTCTIVVTYAPLIVGTPTDTITVSYNDGYAAATSTRAVQAIASAPAFLSVSDGPTYDYGNTTVLTLSADKTFTVTNTGSYLATSIVASGLAAPFTFKGGTYPGTGGTCGTSLASLATCTIVVTYSPTAAVLSTDTIQFDFVDGANPAVSTRNIQGTGATPALLTLSNGPTYNMGIRAIGSTTTNVLITVTNSGDAPATALSGTGLAAPFSFTGGTYPGTSGTCGATILNGSPCTIRVNFSPVGLGVFTDTVELNYHDGVTTQLATRDVQGTGANPALLTISNGATYDYGNIVNGASADFTFTVSNSGGVSATAIAGSGLAAPYTFKGGTYPGTAGTCTATLTAGSNCTIVLTYSPTGLGLHTDTVILTYHNGAVGGQTSTRDLQGTGIAPALLGISDGPTYNYGSVTNTLTSDYTFTVTNSGAVSATSISGSGLAAPFTFKGGAYPGTAGTCTATLAASATCTIVVTYAPTVAGLQSDTINLNYDDGASVGVLSSVNIQGTGLNVAALSISDGPTYNYGSATVGTSVDYTFTVTNTGEVTATALGGSGLAAPFTFKGGAYPGTAGTCVATLAASATCTIVVTYSPTAAVLSTDTVQVDYTNGAATPAAATRAIQGTGSTPALLTLSNGPTYNMGIRAVGSTNTNVFITVTNSGDAAATAMSGAGLAAPFGFTGGTYPGTSGTCGTTLAGGGATCTIRVNFSPSGLGVVTDTVEVNYHDGAAVQMATRGLQGTGANPALLTISNAATYDYGNVVNGAGADFAFTVTNSGGVGATAIVGSGLAAPFTFKGGTYPGTGGTCTASITAGSNCTIVLRYAPTGLGLHTDTAILTYHNGAVAGQTSTRDLQGTGIAPALLSISDGPTYDYGLVTTSTNVDYTFTVTNTGDATATSMSGAGLAAPYTFAGGAYPGTAGTCGATLAGASTTCTIVVNFAPTVLGLQTDTIDINYDNGVAPGQISSVNVQGTGQ